MPRRSSKPDADGSAISACEVLSQLFEPTPAEVGIGLAIVILLFRNRESINVDEVNLLKW
jgi:NADH:ubiquinone oxidoreductase subunit K